MAQQLLIASWAFCTAFIDLDIHILQTEQVCSCLRSILFAALKCTTALCVLQYVFKNCFLYLDSSRCLHMPALPVFLCLYKKVDIIDFFIQVLVLCPSSWLLCQVLWYHYLREVSLIMAQIVVLALVLLKWILAGHHKKSRSQEFNESNKESSSFSLRLKQANLSCNHLILVCKWLSFLSSCYPLSWAFSMVNTFNMRVYLLWKSSLPRIQSI